MMIFSMLGMLCDWKEYTSEESGETIYFNLRTKKTQKMHPLIERFAKIFHKQRTFAKMLVHSAGQEMDQEQQVSHHHYSIVSLSFP
jgi:hypothetical protein